MKKRYETILIKHLKKILDKMFSQKIQGTCCSGECKWVRGINENGYYKYFNYFGGDRCEKIFFNGNRGREISNILFLINKKTLKEVIKWIFSTFGDKGGEPFEIIIEMDKMFKLKKNKLSIEDLNI